MTSPKATPPTRITVSTGPRDKTPQAHLMHAPVEDEPIILTPTGRATAVVVAICMILLIGIVVVLFGGRLA